MKQCKRNNQIKGKIMDAYHYDGLDQKDIDELQKSQKQVVAKLHSFMQHLQQEGHNGTIIVDFNASGDSGFFEVSEDTDVECFEEFFESNNYHLDYSGSPIGTDADSKFIFDWIGELVTTCYPGYEINEGSTGYVVLNFESDQQPTISINVNKFTDTDDEIDESGTEYGWEF
jgi:hypothetical protein